MIHITLWIVNRSGRADVKDAGAAAVADALRIWDTTFTTGEEFGRDAAALFA